jgi:hypothetical protein
MGITNPYQKACVNHQGFFQSNFIRLNSTMLWYSNVPMNDWQCLFTSYSQCLRLLFCFKSLTIILWVIIYIRAPNVKTCPNFQRKCTFTTEDFLHFIRYWKIVAEFLRLTMVIYIHLEKLGQVFTCKARTKNGLFWKWRPHVRPEPNAGPKFSEQPHSSSLAGIIKNQENFTFINGQLWLIWEERRHLTGKVPKKWGTYM